MSRFCIIISLLLFVAWHPIQAQGVGYGSNDVTVQLPAIALLDIEPGGATVSLSIESPAQAGSPVTIGEGASDNSLWINYTSAVATNGPSRSITVQVITGYVPSGLNIKLQAGAYNGMGAGILGVPTGTINLSGTSQPCITSIRGAFTGDGPGNGHRLNYSLEIADYGLLVASENTELTISYTITDN